MSLNIVLEVLVIKGEKGAVIACSSHKLRTTSSVISSSFQCSSDVPCCCLLRPLKGSGHLWSAFEAIC